LESPLPKPTQAPGLSVQPSRSLQPSTPKANGHVSHIPPIIHSARADGSVYLLRWHELEPRVWCAEIAWVQRDMQGWHSQQATVMADDLTPIEGQNYKTVPRQVLRDRFRAPAC
jgi:hypothetical protein